MEIDNNYIEQKKLEKHRKRLEELYIEYKKKPTKENQDALLRYWMSIAGYIQRYIPTDNIQGKDLKKRTKKMLKALQEANPDMQSIHIDKEHIIKQAQKMFAKSNETITKIQKVASTLNREMGGILGMVVSIGALVLKYDIKLEMEKEKTVIDMFNNIPPSLPPSLALNHQQNSAEITKENTKYAELMQPEDGEAQLGM
ncbi:hypothetical protein [Facilibium subflavum]|uniref:hypothetical protein n=1 Tax=Facilibium subflavum TaxID=2219058 RepID=UPI000E6507D9|nr:hypothetical protein [Facilibium subflavum]